MAQVEYCTAVVLVLISTACAGKTATSGPVPDPARYPIVPAPRHLEARSDKFQLDSATRILLSDPASPELRTLAEAVVAPLRAASGLPLPVAPTPTRDDGRNPIAIRLERDSG